MTGEEAMADVFAQVQAIHRGEADALWCPYCNQSNERGVERFCCDLLMKAAIASLDRVDVSRVIEHVDRVMEKATRN